MTRFLFPDNTVLCNFAAAGRLDLLESVLEGRGRWTEAVAFEASRSARFIAALDDLADGRILGEPIEITDLHEIRQVDRMRRAVFGGDERRPLKHLGEAQTCHVILTWSEFAGSWWISDDRESLRYASRRRIPTRETVDLVELAVRAGLLHQEQGAELMHRMVDNGRSPRLLRSAERFNV